MEFQQYEIAFPALAAEINFLHDEAERHANMAVVYAARCGAKLLEVKAGLQHGEWLPWLKVNFHASQQQAAKYAKLAESYPELLDPNYAPGRNLPGIKNALALITADDETKAIVQEKLDAGESVTVREIEELKRLAAEKDIEIERLRSDQAAIAREKEAATQRLISERDREKAKRKQAEAVTKASDREQELARQKAKAEELAERLASELASAKAQIEGGLGVAELLEPKVVIQRDPETERKLAAMTEQFEQMKNLRDRAVKNMAAMHDASLEAQAKLNRMEKSITKVESGGAVLEVFIQQAMDLRAMAQPIAALIQDGSLVLDQAALSAFLELAERLQRLVDMQRNQQALLSAA